MVYVTVFIKRRFEYCIKSMAMCVRATMVKGSRLMFVWTHAGHDGEDLPSHILWYTANRQRMAAMIDGMTTMLSKNDTTNRQKYTGYTHFPWYILATKIHGWISMWKKCSLYNECSTGIKVNESWIKANTLNLFTDNIMSMGLSFSMCIWLIWYCTVQQSIPTQYNLLLILFWTCLTKRTYVFF